MRWRTAALQNWRARGGRGTHAGGLTLSAFAHLNFAASRSDLQASVRAILLFREKVQNPANAHTPHVSCLGTPAQATPCGNRGAPDQRLESYPPLMPNDEMNHRRHSRPAIPGPKK